ncbi:hypothetical protein F5877DRAFT_84496 [Lentinula edodes]|nr:hypothetical protein F5877DRAFT_84496 [Lentinula edodes]
MSIVLVSQPPPNLLKLWDLDLGNVEAPPYVQLHATSPLPPPLLEDANHPHFLGPPSWDYALLGALITTHTMQCSYIYWFPLLPSSTVNVLGTSLDLLGTPSRVAPHTYNYY